MKYSYKDILAGTLVRFRGMIQDMLNPQYYCTSNRIYNSETQETIICNGKYRSSVLNEVRIIQSFVYCSPTFS